MGDREVHTRDSFIEAQLDTVSPTARTLLPLVGADLWFTGEASPAGTPDRLRQRALQLLADWNGEMNEHLPEPLIYAAWMRHLQDRLIRDELGPLANEFTHVDAVFIERVFRDIDGAGEWCNVCNPRCARPAPTWHGWRWTTRWSGCPSVTAATPTAGAGAMRTRRCTTTPRWARFVCCAISSTSANPPRAATTRSARRHRRHRARSLPQRAWRRLSRSL
jgi:hypothetical protein